MTILRRSLLVLSLAALVACEGDPTSPSKVAPLTSGTPVVISGGSSSERIFTIEVPEGTGTLRFLMTGGAGDADLIVRHGARPQSGLYDCVSENIYSEEECIFDLPTPGTWYVLVYGYNSYSSVSLTGTLLSQSGSTALTSGVAVTDLAGGAGSFRMFSLVVPAGADSLRVNLSATGDVDLYIRPSSFPLLNNYLCASFTDTGTETCKVSSPPSGTYYIRVDGYDVFNAGTLTATLYSPAPPP